MACDSFLWGNVKVCAYVNKLHTAAASEKNVEQVMLENVFENISKRLENCFVHPGVHFWILYEKDDE